MAGYQVALYHGNDLTDNSVFCGYAHLMRDRVLRQHREPGTEVNQNFIETLRDGVPIEVGIHTKAINHLCGMVPETFKKHRVDYKAFTEEEVEQVRTMLGSP